MKSTCERVLFQAKMQVIALYFYVKCHFSAGVFKYFTVASQVTGFLIGRTLVGIELTKLLKLTAIKRTYLFSNQHWIIFSLFKGHETRIHFFEIFSKFKYFGDILIILHEE